ncbi:MAG: type II toxin-antitoxin system RelE/ParE family toxin [Chloroflexia bacterium]|nr:type II toxin-antitoxin system RelE/ParE family toxin [Chloroflexia bacterium]
MGEGRVLPVYRDRRTRRFAQGEFIKAFSSIERQADRKLRMLAEAANLNDLAAVPGNRLEALHGDREGQYSVRINDQWRICFEWVDDQTGAASIEITDYH